MYRICLIIFSFLILTGCAAKNFDMAKMTSELPGPAVYQNPKTVEEIEAIKPQLKFPIKLAITQPLNTSWRHTDWSPEELNIMESWGEPLKKAGFASEVIVLPQPVSGDCDRFKGYNNCMVAQDRKLAAQFHADALLILSAIDDVESYPNWFTVLDLTIIGAFIVPAHHATSRTVLEGMLIDNRNEYLYAFQRSNSEVRKLNPLVYTNVLQAVKESREAALRTFGEKMIAEVKKYSDSTPR